MNTATVMVDDDDIVLVEPVEQNSNETSNNTREVDTIVLDDEANDSDFTSLLKNNTLMSKIIQKCWTMHNNAGMRRVVHKTLLPLYDDTDSKFKQSEQFTAVLKTVLRNLRYDPDHKFLHLKSLCEELKAGRFKRKVPFVTLTTDVSKRRRRKNTSQNSSPLGKSDKTANGIHSNKTDVIDVENYNNDCTAAFNVDDSDDSDIIIVNDEHRDNNNKPSNEETNSDDEVSEQCDKEQNRNSEKENTEGSDKENTGALLQKNGDSTGGVNEEHGRIDTIQQHNDQDIINLTENVSNNWNTDAIAGSCTAGLLVPSTSVEFKDNNEPNKAYSIEKHIEFCYKRIQELEEQEVASDGLTSPYMLCDKYKAKIVKLYKRLCKLKGYGDVSLNKQRVVRLQVIDEHPPGPVKRLEQFLNNNIEVSGIIPMPDFQDVLECVTRSNIDDDLGWNKQEMMKEAIALFTHCGNAIRKQRQKREYKDLMSLVKEHEQKNFDPADNDPQLQKRLEENKLIAKANEEEVIEQFVRMENLPGPSAGVRSSSGNKRKLRPIVYSDSDTESDQDIPSQTETEVLETEALETEAPEKEVTETKVPETEVSETEPELTPTGRTLFPPLIGRGITISQGPHSTLLIDGTAYLTSPIPSLFYTEMPVHAVSSSNSNLYCATTQTAVDASRNSIEKMSDHTVQTQPVQTSIQLNTLHKIGHSNRYVIAYQSDKQENDEDTKDSQEDKQVTPEEIKQENKEVSQEEDNKEVSQKTDIKEDSQEKYIKEVLQEDKQGTPESEKSCVKVENIKKEPLDIIALLEKLGDNYITTIFDIEDPFLVIDISSESSDDDL